MDFYHYKMVVYRHCQHTSQYNQLVKVDIALYDPFNVPATSVPTEHVFSKAGELISKRRLRLHPKQVQMTLFLNSNIASF